jgi:putative transposase
MKRGEYTDEKILAILQEVDAGRPAADVARAHGVTATTLYRWKAKYGGMQLQEARRLRQLEDENRRLKHLVADLTLDKQVLQGLLGKK